MIIVINSRRFETVYCTHCALILTKSNGDVYDGPHTWSFDENGSPVCGVCDNRVVRK